VPELGTSKVVQVLKSCRTKAACEWSEIRLLGYAYWVYDYVGGLVQTLVWLLLLLLLLLLLMISSGQPKTNLTEDSKS
jgi:hypothetical protein